jgi:hypothetical protein
MFIEHIMPFTTSVPQAVSAFAGLVAMAEPA